MSDPALLRTVLGSDAAGLGYRDTSSHPAANVAAIDSYDHPHDTREVSHP